MTSDSLSQTLALVIKRFFSRPGAVLLLVFVWKIGLLIFSVQPVPSNDAFFYDGPVVNLLLNGKYANPSIAEALPISGKDVFCAYPPLYQAVLLGWMSVFGTSAVAAMALHLVLFGLYLLVLLALLRRLALPIWASYLAGAFLLVITFHDRPDSLAHVFGIAAVYAWVRSCRALGSDEKTGPARGWAWGMPIFIVLSLATGLQIGAFYFLMLWLGTLLASVYAGEKFPLMPMLVVGLVPAGLVALVAFRFPHLWAGFQEHARQTPSLTPLRVPHVVELLKLVRSAPGMLAAAALAPWLFLQRDRLLQGGSRRFWLMTMAGTLAGVAILGAAMVLLTPNSVFITSYIQPVVVAAYAGLAPFLFAEPRLLRLQLTGLFGLAALGSIRMVGMTTWGLACASDVGYPSAIHAIRTELDGCRAGSATVLSSAYLYEAARHPAIRWVHSDWPTPAERGRPNRDLEGIVALKPEKVILTQFDYYRRYEELFDKLKSQPDLVEVKVLNMAHVRTPDSFKALRQVVQHISWAPVIVSLTWK